MFNRVEPKIIHNCEYNSIEAIKTNILSTENVIEGATDPEPKKAKGPSSEEAGATQSVSWIPI